MNNDAHDGVNLAVAQRPDAGVNDANAGDVLISGELSDGRGHDHITCAARRSDGLLDQGRCFRISKPEAARTVGIERAFGVSELARHEAASDRGLHALDDNIVKLEVGRRNGLVLVAEHREADLLHGESFSGPGNDADAGSAYLRYGARRRSFRLRRFLGRGLCWCGSRRLGLLRQRWKRNTDCKQHDGNTKHERPDEQSGYDNGMNRTNLETIGPTGKS